MISAAHFDFVRTLVHDNAGIVIDQDKEYLAASRLLPIAKDCGFPSVDEMVERLKAGPWSDLHRLVVEAMATTETRFFRDPALFDALKSTILPRLIAARSQGKALSICSAACSSGQEAYSIVMVLRECFPDVALEWSTRVVGVDFNLGMLKRARAGRYSVLEMNRGLPAQMATRYFARDGVYWQVRKDLLTPISFKQLNLTADNLDGPFDLLFMRNVLMYFDDPTRARVLEMARSSLREDGMLVVGATESLLSGDSFTRESTNGATYYLRRSGDERDQWKSRKKISSI